MRSIRRLNCFVAFAFDRPDVELLYDRVILPVLRQTRINSQVVNRVEHNENIDQKIISLINDSDFSIADLTYARPSVYYEAGYSERKMSVIYLARRDHFRQKDADTNGNLTIHFDLQKKNIIPWDSNNLKKTRARLKRRVSYVIQPILRQLRHEQAKNESAYKYSLLSQSDKLSAIELRMSNLLTRHGYKVVNKSSYRSIKYLQYVNVIKGRLIVVNVHPILSATKKYYSSISDLIDKSIQYPKTFQLYDVNGLRIPKFKRVLMIWIPMSLKSASKTILHNVFSDYQIDVDNNHIFKKLLSDNPSKLHICIISNKNCAEDYVKQAWLYISNILEPSRTTP